MLKPTSKTNADGYTKTKQQEMRDRNNVNINVLIDERQLENEIDKAMRNVIKKLNK